MRPIALLMALAVLVPAHVGAQHTVVAPAGERPLAGFRVSDAVELAQLQRPASGSSRRCCNRKGAIIGAVAGAALGAWLTAYTCDAGSCAPSYIRAMGVAGGLGAVLGAFANARPQVPTSFPSP